MHLKDRPPSIRTETYTEDILDKLRWIVSYANDEKVDAVIQLGDIFDVKRADRTSHRLVHQTAEVLGQANSPVLIVPGNHDVQYDQMETIPSQPLGTLALHPNIHLLLGSSHQDLPVYGIPYFRDSSEELDKWMERYAGEQLLVTHASIFPKGKEPIYDYISDEDFARFTEAPHIAYGHIHTPFSHWKAGGSWFLNNGAISRGSLHEETLNRELRVTLYNSDAEGDPFTDVPIPYKDVSEVFKMDIKSAQQEKVKVAEDFRNSLTSSTFSALSLETVLEHASMVMDNQTILELTDILESAK